MAEEGLQRILITESRSIDLDFSRLVFADHPIAIQVKLDAGIIPNRGLGRHFGMGNPNQKRDPERGP